MVTIRLPAGHRGRKQARDRIVFNIRGNAYRLVIAADFEKGIVWIKWLGTHRDYDRIDVREVDRD
jgi:mRNA interferase HigB